MRTRRTAATLVALLSCFSFPALAGKLLDKYDVKQPSLPTDAVVLIRTFSAENANLGTGEQEDKEKAREIARTMQAVAPGTFTQAFVNHLTEAGVFARVGPLDEGALPEKALVVEGEFTLLNPGSRAKRYWVGMGAGKSKICIKGRVVDASGTELGAFEHCRSGTIGWFGGRAEGMMSTDVYQTAFRLADFMAAWGRGEVAGKK